MKISKKKVIALLEARAKKRNTDAQTQYQNHLLNVFYRIKLKLHVSKDFNVKLTLLMQGVGNFMKVFLGGTCNDSKWRDQLIPKLQIDYFNPVVADWTKECRKKEIQERKDADIVLYVVTPRMIGVYSIAEVVDDSNKRPGKTLFCVLPEDVDDDLQPWKFTNSQLRSLEII